MQTRNMEKSENNHQFKIIFNYNIFDKYFSKIFPWYKAVYGAIVFGVGILTVIFERYGQNDLLAEIEEWEKAGHDEPAGYYFSNPDPYLKPQPLSPDHPRHNCYFNEDGHLCGKNLSAFWLPEFTLQKEIGGTVYTVTDSYDGVETMDRKMERIMGEKFAEKMEDSE